MVTNQSENRCLDILLAEDDREERQIFADVLEQIELATQLSIVSNGDMLMDYLSRHLPDLLFLDIYMPCKDGKQCIREIRADRRFDKLPVIIYSGMRDKDIISFCFREGANHYLVKPDTFEELKQALESLLKKFMSN